MGHSTRSQEEFVGLLRSAGVTALVDVRTVPRSRHNPQFNREELERSLPEAGVGYVHAPELGGLRRGLCAGSPNTGWRKAGFRAYADHMLTERFDRALQWLLGLAEREVPAIMCAEAVHWRCHRSLIADALAVRGARVGHLVTGGKSRAHRMTPFARVQGNTVVYTG